jgi:hypothetical protein
LVPAGTVARRKSFIFIQFIFDPVRAKRTSSVSFPERFSQFSFSDISFSGKGDCFAAI